MIQIIVGIFIIALAIMLIRSWWSWRHSAYGIVMMVLVPFLFVALAMRILDMLTS